MVADAAANHVLDSAGAYALGALDLQDRLDVENHSRDCTPCARALGASAATAALLLHAPDFVEPPPGLEARMLARVTAERGQIAPARLPRRRAPWLLGAVAAAAVLALSVLWAAPSLLRETPERVAARLLSSGQRVELTVDRGGGGGAAYLSPSSGEVLIVVSGITPAPDGQTFQLWIVAADGVRQDGGTFNVNERGDGFIVARAAESPTTFRALGITTEPAGGSPGPTSPRVLGARF
ncbi:MAG: anti-sigma factor [Chloroflexota bacterium]